MFANFCQDRDVTDKVEKRWKTDNMCNSCSMVRKPTILWMCTYIRKFKKSLIAEIKICTSFICIDTVITIKKCWTLVQKSELCVSHLVRKFGLLQDLGNILNSALWVICSIYFRFSNADLHSTKRYLIFHTNIPETGSNTCVISYFISFL